MLYILIGLALTSDVVREIMFGLKATGTEVTADALAIPRSGGVRATLAP